MHFNAAKCEVTYLRTENAHRFLLSRKIVGDTEGMQVDMSAQQDVFARLCTVFELKMEVWEGGVGK